MSRDNCEQSVLNQCNPLNLAPHGFWLGYRFGCLVIALIEIDHYLTHVWYREHLILKTCMEFRTLTSIVNRSSLTYVACEFVPFFLWLISTIDNTFNFFFNYYLLTITDGRSTFRVVVCHDNIPYHLSIINIQNPSSAQNDQQYPLAGNNNWQTNRCSKTSKS